MKVALPPRTESVDPLEPIAKEIEALSDAIRKLQTSRIAERGIVVLIHDALPSGGYGRGKICGIPQIRAVLETAGRLRDIYIKKAKPAS